MSTSRGYHAEINGRRRGTDYFLSQLSDFKQSSYEAVRRAATSASLQIADQQHTLRMEKRQKAICDEIDTSQISKELEYRKTEVIKLKKKNSYLERDLDAALEYWTTAELNLAALISEQKLGHNKLYDKGRTVLDGAQKQRLEDLRATIYPLDNSVSSSSQASAGSEESEESNPTNLEPDLPSDPLDLDYIEGNSEVGSLDTDVDTLETMTRLNGPGTRSSSIETDMIWIVNDINISQELMNHQTINLIPRESFLSYIPEILDQETSFIVKLSQIALYSSFETIEILYDTSEKSLGSAIFRAVGGLLRTSSLWNNIDWHQSYLHEDAFLDNLVKPIFDATFGRLPGVTFRWTRDPLLPNDKDDGPIEYPDYMITHAMYPIVLAEIKSPSSQESDRQTDRIKLPNEAKKALDALISDGYSCEVDFLLVQGFRVDVFTMQLRYEAMYFARPLGSFDLIQSRLHFGLLLGLRPMIIAKEIAESTITAIDNGKHDLTSMNQYQRGTKFLKVFGFTDKDIANETYLSVIGSKRIRQNRGEKLLTAFTLFRGRSEELFWSNRALEIADRKLLMDSETIAKMTGTDVLNAGHQEARYGLANYPSNLKSKNMSLEIIDDSDDSKSDVEEAALRNRFFLDYFVGAGHVDCDYIDEWMSKDGSTSLSKALLGFRGKIVEDSLLIKEPHQKL
ncbi:hypothetical protein BGZ49_001513 [Haplosporangium sp. Z 27]|nr:hypothetical protein BGZ49_001513 [Haplosporangium sp. Z 27]